MRFRRRRKPRVLWLPNVGTEYNPSLNVNENSAAIIFSVGSLATGAQTVEAPLVLDNPREVGETGAPLATLQKLSLSQTEDHGYRLRRIVGNIFFSAENGNSQNVCASAVLIEAGLIVRRVDAELGTSLAGAADTDVGSLQNNQDPWIWRRNWILSPANTGANSTDEQIAYRRFPGTNVEYGSAKEGCAVDQKTARVVGPEERLFLDVSIWELPMPATFTHTAQVTVNCFFDYRVLASIHVNRGNRNNASR